MKFSLRPVILTTLPALTFTTSSRNFWNGETLTRERDALRSAGLEVRERRVGAE